MIKLFEELLPSALQCEISIFDFWEMTLAEIILIMNNYQQSELNRMKERAGFDYALANLIGMSVGRLLDKNNKFPAIHEIYPSLFEEEKPQQQDWRIAKERMMKYTKAHNKKIEVKANDS